MPLKQNTITQTTHKMLNSQRFSICENPYHFALIKKTQGRSWEQFKEQQCLHVVNCFEEKYIPFCSLCIMIVKIYVTCNFDIHQSIFFTTKEKHIFKYNATEYNGISLVTLFLFKTTCIILYHLVIIVYNTCHKWNRQCFTWLLSYLGWCS